MTHRLLAPVLAALLAFSGAGAPTAPRTAPAAASKPAANLCGSQLAPGTDHWFAQYGAESSAPVTGVAASLVVPSATIPGGGCGGNDLWIGIQSLRPASLIQAGIWLGADGAMDAWWATVDPGVGAGVDAPPADRVRVGDRIRFTIAWTGGRWQLAVRDWTAGWVWRATIPFPPPAGPGAATYASEWGPVAYAHGQARFWWPTLTTSDHVTPAVVNSEYDVGGLHMVAARPPHQIPLVFQDR